MSVAAPTTQLRRAVRSTHTLPIHGHNELHAHGVRFYFSASGEKVRQIATSAAGEMDSVIKPINGLENLPSGPLLEHFK